MDPCDSVDCFLFWMAKIVRQETDLQGMTAEAFEVSHQVAAQPKASGELDVGLYNIGHNMEETVG